MSDLPSPALAVQPNAEDLTGLLRIYRPGALQQSQTGTRAFSFDRLRELSIDWLSITTGIQGGLARSSKEPLRRYLERSWGLEPATSSDEYVAAYSQASDKFIFQFVPKGETELVAEQVLNGVVVQHGTSGRYYLLTSEDGKPLPETVLDTPEGEDPIEVIWRTAAGLKLVTRKAQAGDEAKPVNSSAIYTTNEVNVILEQVESLIPKYQAAYTLYERALKELDHLLTADLQTDQVIGQPDKIAAVREAVGNLGTEERNLRRQLGTLQDRARALGFSLVVEKKEITLPDNTTRMTIKPGLYRLGRTTFTWQVTQTVTEYRSDPCSSRLRRRTFTEIKSAKIVTYEPVTYDPAPYLTAIFELLNKKPSDTLNGFRLHVLNPSPFGYVTDKGERARDILRQCDLSEAFRETCIIVIPEFDSIVTADNRRQTRGYWIYHRPLPGIMPSQLPQVFVKERLAYTMEWRGVELGPLLRSINLAPGEQRTFSFNRATQFTTTQTSTTSQIFEASTAESAEFSEELETEFRKETEESSSVSAGANAGVALGPISFGGSVSTTSSSNLKTFSRNMQKVARKAARSFNQKATRSQSVTSTVSTSVSESETTGTTIANPNSGKTMNLFFYQLRNIFLAGLKVDALELAVVPTVELIAGAGVYDVELLSLHDLERVPTLIGPASLPLPVTSANAYWNHLLEQFTELLEDDYAIKTAEDDEGEERAARDTSARVLALQPPRHFLALQEGEKAADALQRLRGGQLALARTLQKRAVQTGYTVRTWVQGNETLRFRRLVEDGEGLPAQLRRLQEILEKAETSEDLLQPEDIEVTSNGIYLDVQLGQGIATEPYVERLREQELQKLAVANDLVRAQAKLERAKAEALRGHNRILKVTQTGNRLLVTLARPLTAGTWTLFYLNQSLVEFDTDAYPGRMVEVQTAADIEVARQEAFTLVNLEKREVVFFA